MNQHTVMQCVKILFHDWNKDTTKDRFHYAFAVRKNKILAVGKNQTVYPSYKILEIARTYNIEKWLEFPYPHAESDLITKLPPNTKFKNIEILSLRINRHGQFRLAKPCRHCQKMLDGLNITKVSWSSNDSEYWGNELILQKQTKINVELHTLPINNACKVFMNLYKKETKICS